MLQGTFNKKKKRFSGILNTGGKATKQAINTFLPVSFIEFWKSMYIVISNIGFLYSLSPHILGFQLPMLETFHQISQYTSLLSLILKLLSLKVGGLCSLLLNWSWPCEQLRLLAYLLRKSHKKEASTFLTLRILALGT